MTTSNKSKVDEFCARLFASTELPLLSEELKGFRDAMVASLLMYYEDVKKDLGPGSLIIKAMHQAATTFRISDSPELCVKTLSEWAAAVRTRFIAANAKNLGDVDLTEMERQGRIIETMQGILVQNLDMNKKLGTELEFIKGELSDVKSMLHQLCMNDSPRVHNKKRSRIESPSLSPSNSSTAIAEQSEAAAPPTSINDALMGGILASEYVDFSGCGDWTCGFFLSKCILSLQDADSTSKKKLWLGNINSKLRAKCKRVYGALRNRATDGQKMYFQASRYPATNAALTDFSNEAQVFVPSLVDAFVNEMLQRMHPQDWQEKKNRRGVNVSAIEKLMQQYEKHQKEEGDNPWVDIGVLCSS